MAMPRETWFMADFVLVAYEAGASEARVKLVEAQHNG